MKSPSFQFFSADWLSGRSVRLMDAEQRGWYIQLLAESWESDPQGTLPNDDALLRALAGANTCSTDVERRWNFVKERFKKRGQIMYNERLMEEVVRQEENRRKKSDAGKASAEVRKRREAIKTEHLARSTQRNRRATPVEQKGEQDVNATPTESNLPTSSSISSFSSSSSEELKDKSIVAPASPETTGEGESRSRSSQAVEIFEYWKEIHGKNGRAVFDARRKRAVEGRLKDGHPVSIIMQAIRGIKFDPHCAGENEQRKVYDDLELICRDASHLERYAALDRAPVSSKQAAPDVCTLCKGARKLTAYSFVSKEDEETVCPGCHGGSK